MPSEDTRKPHTDAVLAEAIGQPREAQRQRPGEPSQWRRLAARMLEWLQRQHAKVLVLSKRWGLNKFTSTALGRSLPRPAILFSVLALLGVLVWSYSSPLAMLVHRWWNEPDYLHGFLVPVFAGVLLWVRRDMIKTQTLQGSWWGLAFLGLCAAMRWTSACFFLRLIDPLSLVPCLAGLVLLIGGWRALRWAWPSLVFLVFAVPLPGFFADVLSHPLQRTGTIASTYVIQTLGIPAVAQGNVIVLTEAKVGVVEACNGLRMMMLFFAVCVGAAFLMRRNPVDKIIVVLSAVPIALIANVGRITVTSLLHETVSHDLADALFHDLAGWFMMPLAIVLLWMEIALLSKLLIEPAPKSPLALGVSVAGGSREARSEAAAKHRGKA